MSSSLLLCVADTPYIVSPDLVSSFVRTPRLSTIEQETTSEVTLIKARVICDAKTGQVDVSWPGSSDVHQDLSATIGDAVFSAGKTKHVYKVCLIPILICSGT